MKMEYGLGYFITDTQDPFIDNGGSKKQGPVKHLKLGPTPPLIIISYLKC